MGPKSVISSVHPACGMSVCRVCTGYWVARGWEEHLQRVYGVGGTRWSVTT